MKRILTVTLILAALVVGACVPKSAPATTTPESPADMPNPASKHCVDQGYKLEIRSEAGGEVGYCLFPDGSECEEWAFYRGECAPGGAEEGVGMPNPASKYCVDQGYKLEIRTEAGGEVGYCLFPDGSECEEWAFYRGECAPGDQESIGMPNPASVHCADEGGKLEIRDEAGGQVGYCIFPDGSECEEWAFYRGECAPGDQKSIGMPNPASVHCADEGGKLEIRDEAGGQAGYCIFPDGSECEEWAFYRGECAPGDQESIGMPNPASVHCADEGGKLEIRDEAGGQAGYCIFPDGSECEEWAFYRGECAPGDQESIGMPNPASVHCADEGGKLEIRDEAGGQAGYCIFPDGSECEEWAFYRGECAPGEGKQIPDMPNPASKYCTDQGYKLEIRSEAGGDVGYCLFPDGSECEEWAFYRGECAPATAKRIRFQPGATTAIEQGSLAAGGMAHYVLAATAGQIMSVNISSSQGSVILAIWGADGTVLISDHAGTTHWSGQLPSTQDYYINAISVGGAAANYTLQVTIPPKPQPSPEPVARRISFQPGATTAVEHGTVAAGGMDRYVLKALAGQTMSVNVSSSQGQVILVIYGADGTVLISDHAGTTHWSGRLPSTQDYYIDAKSVASVAVEYTLQVTIPPGPSPQPATKRISFAPGSTTAVERGSVAAGGADRYVLEAMADQTMSVQVSSSQGQVILVIWGVDGTVLISDHAGATDWSGPLPSTQDYYISVQSVGSVTANYTLEVTIPPRR